MNPFDNDLLTLDPVKLKAELLRLRQGIREHRDEKGHGRCWLDDLRLYDLLPEKLPADTTLPPREEFLENCARFHETRQGKKEFWKEENITGGRNPSKPFLSANIIGVRDVESARIWYADVFGMELVTLKLPYFCEMKLGDASFLIEKHSLERPLGFQDIPTGVRVSAIIGVDDIKAFIDIVREKGVTVVHNPVQQAWGGWNAVIRDPDGNEFVIDQDE
ncbi:VOC family protein [Candidatus Woesearchaeota archaeon]|nr:VOC family protein [Candidatus Woesearchaeota archaeon]